MKEWRIDLVNASHGKNSDPARAKQLTDMLTVSMLHSIKNSDPEAWEELKSMIAEVDKR